jgi:hypothetical protein
MKPLPELTRAQLTRLDPAADELLLWLRPRIDDGMLEEIADADYGMDAAEHLAALRRIRDANEVPAPMGWEPKEVLELIRWSEPENPAWKPGSTGERGHLLRAFCCAALLRAGGEPANRPYFDGENNTIIQLIASVLTLGSQAATAALRLLCWRALERPAETDEQPFFALGILLLTAALYRNASHGALLRDLSEWVIAEEAAARAQLEGMLPPASDAWLIGLSFFDQRDTAWREVGWRVLVTPPEPHPAEAHAALQALAERLVLGYAEG